MHECWSNVHMLPGSSICQLFFFLRIYQSQVANVVKSNYTLPTFAHMYAHTCVFFPKSVSPPTLLASSSKGKTKKHSCVNLFENNSSNKLSIIRGLCPDPTSSGGPVSHYHTNTKKPDSLIMLVTPSLLYHPTPNHAVAVNGGVP